MKKAITYYRVSTQRQGQSGLGLEAQQQAVRVFVASNHLELAEEYTEVESSRKKRPVLQTALAACRKENAILLIAKLDRLARNVLFVSQLLESKVEFLAVDMPYANRLIIHVMAAFAEYEHEQISIRTSSALQAAKKRGVQLGRHGKEVLSQENSLAADRFALCMKPVIEGLKTRGFTTIRQISGELNRLKVPTFRGEHHRWHVATVYHVLCRCKKIMEDQDAVLPLIA